MEVSVLEETLKGALEETNDMIAKLPRSGLGT